MAVKKALVTGASSGIGRSMALELARRGVTVFALARRQEHLRELANIYPQLIYPVVGDVTSEKIFDLLTSSGAEDCDILINNAGLALGRSAFSVSEWSEAERMIDVNVKAAFRLSHFFLPRLMKKKAGDIIHVCSIAGHETYPGGAVYCATKHALWAFTKVLREESCGHNVRVMQISPGMVESEFSQVRFKGDLEKARAVYAGMKPLTPEDVARTMIFMLEQPRHVCWDEVTLMPTDQGSPTTVSRTS